MAQISHLSGKEIGTSLYFNFVMSYWVEIVVPKGIV
jgi:hypothetical protein